MIALGAAILLVAMLAPAWVLTAALLAVLGFGALALIAVLFADASAIIDAPASPGEFDRDERVQW